MDGFSEFQQADNYLDDSMAETDPKSVQDLTNVVSRDLEASISCSSLALRLIASSNVSKKVPALKEFVAFIW